MTSKIVVNNIEADAGVSTVTFGSEISASKIVTSSGEFTVGTGASVYSPATNVLALGTNNAERVRIDSSGRLIVGVNGATSTTCSAIFQGRSDGATNSALIRLAKGSSTPGSADSLGIIQFSDSGTKHAAQIQASRDGGTWTSGTQTPASLLFFTSPDSATGATERLRITSDGKIGFNYAGTPPSEDIMICTSGQASPAGISLSHLSGGNRYGARLQSISGANEGIVISSLFNSTYTERLRITSSGNVGIGTDNPSGKLEINSGNDNLNFFLNSTDGDVNLGMADTGGSIRLLQAGGELAFRVGGAANLFGSGDVERLRIDSSGRVLVGASSWTGDGLFVVEGRVASGASNATIQLARGDDDIPSNNGVGLIDFTNNAANIGAKIYAIADANWTSGTSHPTRLEFYTAAAAVSPVRRMWVNSAGQLRFDSSNGGGIIFENSGNRIFFGGPTNASVGTSSAGNGSTTLYIGNAAIQVSSDVRLKENIEDTELDALDAISQIKVKDFTWNDPTDTSHNNRNARGKWTGLIAQELVEVLPFVVNAPRKEEDGSIDHDSEDRWTLDQSQLCPVLIKAIQQQQEVIASQAATIAALDARLTTLEGN